METIIKLTQYDIGECNIQKLLCISKPLDGFNQNLKFTSFA